MSVHSLRQVNGVIISPLTALVDGQRQGPPRAMKRAYWLSIIAGMFSRRAASCSSAAKKTCIDERPAPAADAFNCTTIGSGSIIARAPLRGYTHDATSSGRRIPLRLISSGQLEKGACSIGELPARSEEYLLLFKLP